MKKLLQFALFIFSIQTIFAQTASDYFMPFCVGNQAVLETPESPLGSWARLATFTFVKTDIIGSEINYVEEGKEYFYEGVSDPAVFHNLWLSQDVNGDVWLNAFSDVYPILDSAEILATPFLYFSHNYLTLGYSVTQTVEPGHDVIDSVISTNAVFGVYHNCIQIRETDVVNDTITNIGDTYYAYGIGRVGQQGVYPADDITTSTLVATFITGCDPILDSLSGNVVDSCLGDYFDYYVSDLLADTSSNTVTATWVFQDGVITNTFTQTYNYLNTGNYVISITLNCSGKKANETYYKSINIASSPLSIDASVMNKSDISIYPNPAQDVIIVSNTILQTAVLNIYDLMGALVKTVTLNQNQQQINTADLCNGIYVVEIKSKDWTEKQKLIIQR